MAQEREWPGVSVVVPSLGRPELLDAVASVTAQDYPGEVQTVVVLDGHDDHAPLTRTLEASGATVRITGTRAGANRARNLGTQISGGDLVAYLDDDDLWEPTKLRTQILRRESQQHPGDSVLSCRVRWHRPGAPDTSRPVPHALLSDSQRVEDYLFRRRRPSLGRGALYTSTLLAPKALAMAVPWDESLPRHQDWDWVTRVQDEASARFAMCPEALVVCATGSTGSISAASDWEASLEWVARRGAAWSPTTRSDFLMAQSLRYALQARSGRGVRTVLGAVGATRRVPSLSAGAIGAGGLVPRQVFESLTLRSGRAR